MTTEGILEPRNRDFRCIAYGGDLWLYRRALAEGIEGLRTSVWRRAFLKWKGPPGIEFLEETGDSCIVSPLTGFIHISRYRNGVPIHPPAPAASASKP